MDTSAIEDSNDSELPRDQIRLSSQSTWAFRPRSSTGGSSYSRSRDSDFEDVQSGGSLVVIESQLDRGECHKKINLETILVNKQSLAEILTPVITHELINRMDWSDSLHKCAGTKTMLQVTADLSQSSIFQKLEDRLATEEVITPKTEVSDDLSLTQAVCDSTSVLPTCTVTQPLIGRKKIIRRPSLLAAFPSRSRDGRMELVIVSQPEEQHRARYMTEGSRGSIKDRSGTGFPSVKLLGYNQPAVLQVFIGSDQGKVQPHLFYQACKVSGKNCTPCVERRVDGTAVIELNMNPDKEMTVCCDCIGILKERNVDVEQRLPYFSVGRSKKSTRCRMVFRVCIPVGSTGFDTLQLASAPILCTQPPGVPEISKKSLTECPVTGGTELYIIGKNFLKDAKVIFQEVKSEAVDDDDPQVIWQQVVTPEKEYLHQTHLVCEIPPYHQQSVTSPVKTQLLVQSGGKRSEPHAFYFIPGTSRDALGMNAQISVIQMSRSSHPVSTSCESQSSAEVILSPGDGYLDGSSSLLINPVSTDSSPSLVNCMSSSSLATDSEVSLSQEFNDGSPSLEPACLLSTVSNLDHSALSHASVEGGQINPAVEGDGQPLLVMKSNRQSHMPVSNSTYKPFINSRIRMYNNRIVTRRRSLTHFNTPYFNPQRRFLVRRAVHPYSLYSRHLMHNRQQYQRGRQAHGNAGTQSLPSTQTVIDPVTNVEQTGIDVVEITDSLNQSTSVLDARTGQTLATMVQAGDMQLANVDGETKIVRLTSQDNPGTVSHIEMNDSQKPGGLTLTDVLAAAAAGGGDVSVVDVRTTSPSSTPISHSITTSQILSTLSPHMGVTQDSIIHNSLSSPVSISLNPVTDINLNLHGVCAGAAEREALLDNMLPSSDVTTFTQHINSSTNHWQTTTSPASSFTNMSPQEQFLQKDVVPCAPQADSSLISHLNSSTIPSMYLPACSGKSVMNVVTDSPISTKIETTHQYNGSGVQIIQAAPTPASGQPNAGTDYNPYQQTMTSSLSQLSDADLLSMINPCTFDNSVIDDIELRRVYQS